MKGFGYQRGSLEEEEAAEDSGPLELREVSLGAMTHEDLRVVARFLLDVADEFEENGEEFGHSHLRDWLSTWKEDDVDLIVYRATRHDA